MKIFLLFCAHQTDFDSTLSTLQLSHPLPLTELILTIRVRCRGQVYVLTGTDNPSFEAQAYDVTIRKAMEKQARRRRAASGLAVPSHPSSCGLLRE